MRHTQAYMISWSTIGKPSRADRALDRARGWGRGEGGGGCRMSANEAQPSRFSMVRRLQEHRTRIFSVGDPHR